ncbi:MAG: GntR family transcriptional regulator [Paenibacillaceae bacterium]|jgi:GntR family transcriptional regulator of arabinose operon|nr:GntR family transcriptional regulator [Paenibacillaceae bacterium]
MERKEPLYHQIQNYILEQIQSGVWQPNDQLPPERDLADQFKVSRITAKNAVLGLVGKGILYRHRGKGTFVSETGALQEELSPVITPHKTIGLLLPPMEFHYSSLLLTGVEETLGRNGHHLLFKRIPDSSEEESKAISAFLDAQADGLIILSRGNGYFNDEMIKLALTKFPLVFVEKFMRDYKSNAVYCDTEKAGYLLGQYAAHSGRKQLGYMTYPSEFRIGVKERMFGMQSALVDHGISPIPAERCLQVSPKLLEGLSHLEHNLIPAQFEEFLHQHPKMDAIIAADALTARYAGIACRATGRNDMLIICCDKPQFELDCVLPSAYVDQFPLSMGQEAARLLLETLDNPDTQSRHVVIEPKLIQTKSI